MFNKEKVEKKYFKDSFIYALYFNKENMPKMFANIENEKIIELISEKIYNKNENKPQVVYNSSNGKIYDQLKDLRNAFAHMSYGSFCIYKNCIFTYKIYNKNSNLEEKGYVIENLTHDFIKKFFSNNVNYGFAYKHTYVIAENKKFLEIKYSNSKNKYFGKNFHEMNNKIFGTEDLSKILEYIDKENFSKKYIKIENYNELKEIFNKKNFDYKEFAYTIKAIYDIETEFSNFLIHLIQLNDLIIYSIISARVDEELINASIEELEEDKSSSHIFKIFFILLKSYNLGLKIEIDKKNVKEKCKSINKFKYDKKNLEKYLKNKNVEEFNHCDYMLERFRNSIIHGNFKLKFENKKFFVQFIDKYYEREEVLEIEIGNLKKFIKKINSETENIYQKIITFILSKL